MRPQDPSLVVSFFFCVLLVGLRGEQRRAVGHRLEYGHRRDATLHGDVHVGELQTLRPPVGAEHRLPTVQARALAHQEPDAAVQHARVRCRQRRRRAPRRAHGVLVAASQRVVEGVVRAQHRRRRARLGERQGGPDGPRRAIRADVPQLLGGGRVLLRVHRAQRAHRAAVHGGLAPRRLGGGILRVAWSVARERRQQHVPARRARARPAHLAGDAQRHVPAQLLARRRVVHARAFEQAAKVTRPCIVLGGPRQPAPGARARPRLHHVLEQLPAPRPDVGDAVGIPVCYSRALHHRDDEDAALLQPASERRRRGEVLRDFVRVAVHDGDARGLPQRRQGEHALVAELVPLNHAHVAERQLAL